MSDHNDERSTAMAIAGCAIAAVVVLAALGSRNPNVILGAVVLAALVVLALGGRVALWASRRRRARREAQEVARLEREDRQNATWRHFTRPAADRDDLWVVGIEQVTPGHITLRTITISEMHPDDEIARLDAEGLAMSRAVLYNRSAAPR
jgi:Flp pilus assembly protein TadB